MTYKSRQLETLETDFRTQNNTSLWTVTKKLREIAARCACTLHAIYSRHIYILASHAANRIRFKIIAFILTDVAIAFAETRTRVYEKRRCFSRIRVDLIDVPCSYCRLDVYVYENMLLANPYPGSKLKGKTNGARQNMYKLFGHSLYSIKKDLSRLESYQTHNSKLKL